MTIAIHSLHELQDPDILAALLREGEGQTLEYKARMPSTPHLARNLAAFANAEGGLLLVGFDERSGKVTGLDDPANFVKQVDAALKHVNPYPGSASYGVVEYPPESDSSIGAILIWPGGRQPLVVNGGYYARRGNRMVTYEGAGELHALSSLPETAATQVRLRISTKEIDEFLSMASEDIFTDLLVAPLMRARGFSLSRKGHRDKTLEFGQDLRAMKYQLPTGHWLYFAAQIKAGPISYSAEKSESIDKILEQIRMAFNAKMIFWDIRSEHRPDHVFLVASGQIAEGARVYLHDAISENRMKVLFWDKEQIVEECVTNGLPEPMQADIRRYLSSASDDDGGDAA